MIAVALLAATAMAADPGPAPVATPAPAHRGIEGGVEILGVWGLAARLTDRTHRGMIDAIGLRAGFLAGPGPFFGDERTLAALFGAVAVDLFPHTPWQLEITGGPAWLDRDGYGGAVPGAGREPGLVLGVAGRARSEGPFQINVGPVLLTNLAFDDFAVLVDLSPGWQWPPGGAGASR